MLLDETLNFNHHIKEKTSESMKKTGAIKKLTNILPRNYLLTNYKAFVRSQINYGVSMYNELSNETFSQKMEMSIRML